MSFWSLIGWSGSDSGPGIWRAEVTQRVAELEHRLTVVKAGWSREEREDPEHVALAQAVEDSLGNATSAVKRDRKGRIPAAWWTGSSMTAGWESVHEAESYMLKLVGEEDGKTMLPWLLAWIERVMDAGWLRRRHEKALRKQITDAKFDRTEARQALRDVIVANNTRYANLRAFRNNLVVITGLLALLVLVLVVWNLFDPGIVSLAAEVDDEGKVTGGSGGADVALVALFGALGGALAIAFGLAKTKAPPSRYDPKTWLGLLKPVAGAATAVVAVVFIEGDLLLASEDIRSKAALLSYAAIFGLSQQLLTRFVDKRAESLIDAEEPSKEPED